MQKTNTVCLISALFYPHVGGVERYTFQLAQKLVARGINIIVLTTNTNDAPSRESLDGIKIFRLPIHQMFGDRYPIPKKNNLYKSIINEIAATHIDHIVINTRFYLTTLLGLRLAKQKNIKPIVIEHGTGHFTVNNIVLDFFGRIYEKFITGKVKRYEPRFFGVSGACNRWLEHFGIQSSGILYNGVDASYSYTADTDFRTERNLPENAFIVTFAGRMIREKGISDFIEAAQKVTSDLNDVFFVAAGSGPLLSVMQASASGNNNIIFLGNVDYSNMMDLLRQTDVLLNPSRYPEGLPTIILEAGLNKCAVIATPQGGTPEVINDNTGVIVETRNVDEMVAAVRMLYNDRNKLKHLSENLYNNVTTDFDWDVLAIKLIEEAEVAKS